VLVLDRGSSAAGPGVAELYAESLLGSSDAYKAKEAWPYLTFVGGSVSQEIYRDSITFEISALSPLFVSALSRAAPMFTAPSLDADDVDEARTTLAAQHAGKGDRPAEVVFDALYAAVFASPHPYGTPISGEAARLSQTGSGAARPARAAGLVVSDDAVRAFRAAQLTAGHIGVAVVGDFKPASMQVILEKALGKVRTQGTASATPFTAIAPKGGRKITIIDRPGAAQSTVGIGWPGVRASDPDLVTLDVLAGATAGDLSTRLNITVRKELGATYGVQMHAVGLREAGLIRIATAIDTSRTVEALRGLFAELERLRTEPLTPAELGAAKLRTYHDLERGSVRGLASYLGRAIAEGQPPAHVVTHNLRVDAVNAESVRAAAERYLALDEARVVIVGDASRIAEGLRSLGNFEVTVTR